MIYPDRSAYMVVVACPQGGRACIRCYTATPVRPPRPRVLVGLALLALSSACGGWRGHGDTYYKRWEAGPIDHEATYRFGAPGDGWRPLDQKGTQVAWFNEELDAAILLDSQCESHGDSTLEQFTDHLRIDFREWEVQSQVPLKMIGREALRTIVVASIDGGVQTKMELYVVKKNGCLFDLEYIAPPASFERGRPAFARVVAGFEFPVRG